jgi:hypothetical protein
MTKREGARGSWGSRLEVPESTRERAPLDPRTRTRPAVTSGYAATARGYPGGPTGSRLPREAPHAQPSPLPRQQSRSPGRARRLHGIPHAGHVAGRAPVRGRRRAARDRQRTPAQSTDRAHVQRRRRSQHGRSHLGALHGHRLRRQPGRRTAARDVPSARARRPAGGLAGPPPRARVHAGDRHVAARWRPAPESPLHDRPRGQRADESAQRARSAPRTARAPGVHHPRDQLHQRVPRPAARPWPAPAQRAGDAAARRTRSARRCTR